MWIPSKLDLTTRVVIGVMTLCGFMYATAIVFSVSDQFLIDRISRGEFVADAELLASDMRRQQMSRVVLGSAMLFSLTWAFWTFRFLRRARQPGYPPRGVRPVWDALSIFVPIVNLWHPYLVTSATADRLGAARSTNTLLLVWQVVGAVAVAVRMALPRILMPSFETVAELSLQMWIGAASLGVQIAAVWLTGSVVATLTNLQLANDAAMPAPTTKPERA